MHSRIFQVSLNPIKREDYITESNYYDHWFTSGIADYVSDVCNRDEDILWLKDCVKGLTFGTDNNGEYLIVENKEVYFEKKFTAFIDVLNKLKDCTLRDFTDGMSITMYALNNAYDSKYGFYVDAEEEMLTFDDFIRLCVSGEKYYIGGTCDYHC